MVLFMKKKNVNVSRIRKRLNDLGIEDAVNTVRGVGYKLNKNWQDYNMK